MESCSFGGNNLCLQCNHGDREADLGTIQMQSGHTFGNLRKSAKPLLFNGRSREMVEGEKLFQTSAIQRKRSENGRPLPRVGKGCL
jgi:hypothetical protein